MIGDGRAVLQHAKDQSYGLIIIDAFSSDVVPTHLLTLEAVKTYLQKLSTDGALVIHGTSRYYNFKPLLVALARRLNVALLYGSDEAVNGNREQEMIYPSTWFILTHNKNLVNEVTQAELWQNIDLSKETSEVLWTDDYASQTALLKIRVH